MERLNCIYSIDRSMHVKKRCRWQTPWEPTPILLEFCPSQTQDLKQKFDWNPPKFRMQDYTRRCTEVTRLSQTWEGTVSLRASKIPQHAFEVMNSRGQSTVHLHSKNVTSNSRSTSSSSMQLKYRCTEDNAKWSWTLSHWPELFAPWLRCLLQNSVSKWKFFSFIQSVNALWDTHFYIKKTLHNLCSFKECSQAHLLWSDQKVYCANNSLQTASGRVRDNSRH